MNFGLKDWIENTKKEISLRSCPAGLWHNFIIIDDEGEKRMCWKCGCLESQVRDLEEGIKDQCSIIADGRSNNNDNAGKSDKKEIKTEEGEDDAIRKIIRK